LSLDHGGERSSFGGGIEDRSTAVGAVGVVDEILKSCDSFLGADGALFTVHNYDYTPDLRIGI